MTQLDLFGATRQQQFDAWKEKPGAKHILRDLYAIAARFVPDWKRYGLPVSVKLIVEVERQRMKTREARYRRWYKGALPRSHGYVLNNTFTAYIARHIEAHKPEWRGLFEKRETGVQRHKRKVRVIVVEELQKAVDIET